MITNKRILDEKSEQEVLEDYLRPDNPGTVYGGFYTIDDSAVINPGPDPLTMIGVNRG